MLLRCDVLRFRRALRGGLVAACLAALLPACASSAGPRDALGWMEARGADLMDVVGVRVAFGAGLGVYARATEYVQLGFMLRGPGETELPRPEGSQLRAVPCLMLGTIGRYGGVWLDSTHETMLPGWTSRDTDLFAVERELLVGYVSPRGRLDDRRLALGAGLHFILVGAEAEVRPWEIIDFLAGLLGYDLSADDVPVASPGDEGSAES